MEKLFLVLYGKTPLHYQPFYTVDMAVDWFREKVISLNLFLFTAFPCPGMRAAPYPPSPIKQEVVCTALLRNTLQFRLFVYFPFQSV